MELFMVVMALGVCGVGSLLGSWLLARSHGYRLSLRQANMLYWVLTAVFAIGTFVVVQAYGWNGKTPLSVRFVYAACIGPLVILSFLSSEKQRGFLVRT
jgi:H+/Cl- antiporter ClcA